MSKLQEESTIDLINELRDRSVGGVFSYGIRGQHGEFVTGFDSENLTASVGLLHIIKTRIEIHLEDTYQLFTR
jgi:hypothetical protein